MLYISTRSFFSDHIQWHPWLQGFRKFTSHEILWRSIAMCAHDTSCDVRFIPFWTVLG